MKHSEIEKNLLIYLDGGLDGRMKINLEEHLSQCPRCGEKLAMLAAVWNDESKNQKLEPTAYLWSKIESSLNESGQGSPKRAYLDNLSYLFKYSFAAIMLIASILIGNYIGSTPEFSPDQNPEASENRYLVKNYHLDSFASTPDESIGMTIYLTSDNRK